MAEIGSAFVTIAPSAKGFGSSLNSQVSGETRSVGSTIGRTFGKMFVLGASLIAAAGIGNLLKGSIEEAREAQKVGAATEQIIKSTGKAANLSAVQIGNMAEALSKKIGVDDEEIQKGQNLLLTFKNVRNEVGKGADIFTRATAAGADLAASGFGSIESNAKTLGKALNDPVKGMTALTRAGVTFTAAQQERIKGMVEEGNLLGAQKLLLAEVESQVGGVAAATATAGDKAGVAWGNIKEQIGTALLPILDRVATVFAERIAPAISRFVANLGNGTGAAGKFSTFVSQRVLPVLSSLVNFIINRVVPAYRNYLMRVLAGAREAFAAIRQAVADNEPQLRQMLAALQAVGIFVLTRLVPALGTLVGFIVKNLGNAIAIGVNNLGRAVKAFNAMRSAAQTVGSAVQSAFSAISGIIQGLIDKVQALIDKIQSIPTPNLPDLNPLNRAGAVVTVPQNLAALPTKSPLSGSGGGGEVISELRALRAAVERVAPGVGGEINGAFRAGVRKAQAA